MALVKCQCAFRLHDADLEKEEDDFEEEAAAGPKTGKHNLCEPAQWICRVMYIVWKSTGKMAADTSGDIVLC